MIIILCCNNQCLMFVWKFKLCKMFSNFEMYMSLIKVVLMLKCGSNFQYVSSFPLCFPAMHFPSHSLRAKPPEGTPQAKNDQPSQQSHGQAQRSPPRHTEEEVATSKYEMHYFWWRCSSKYQCSGLISVQRMCQKL